LTIAPRSLTLADAREDKECHCALLGCLITVLIIPLILLPDLVRSLAIRGPDHRYPGGSSPNVRMRGLGGIALATSLLAVATLIYFVCPEAWVGQSQINAAVIWTALAMLFLGLWNDFRPISFSSRLLLQTLISAAAYFQGVQMDVFGNPLTDAAHPFGIWSGVVTVLWLVALTNLISYANRIHGLAGSIGLILLATLALIDFESGAEFSALCAIGLAGALLGSLVHHLPPTRLRLGAGTASFIGFLIGSLTALSSEKGSALSATVLVGIVALPLLSLCLRAKRRSPMSPLVVHLDPRSARRHLSEIGSLRIPSKS
jgi:UDP-GlcNAc:undecaprenyl-phosphate/decaprenyl-phosphate GlcNAc-1-phosphate transferase